MPRARPLALLALLLTACRRDPSPSPEPRASATASVTASVTASATASAPVSASAPVITRSKPPTVAEWKTATKLALYGADWVGCVAEGVREWVRVSCHGPSLAGTPLGIRVTKGKGPDVMPYAKGGVTSLLFRYVPGLEIDALFGWEEGSLVLPLAIRWPADQVSPPSPIGGFKSVPKEMPEKVRQDACECFWSMADTYRAVGNYTGPTTRPSKTDACAGVPAHPWRFHCLLTHQDCGKLHECNILGGPGVYVECLPGEVYTGAYPTAYCGRVCAGAEDCPEGFTCGEDDGRGQRVCASP